MTLLTLTKYSKAGASSRYRYYNYKESFKKEGINMIISPLLNQNYFKATHKYRKIYIIILAYLKRFLEIIKILIKPKKVDLIIIEYEIFPYFPAWFEWLLFKRKIKYIVDYDDAIFHKYDKNILLKSKISKVMKYASRVIVCNAYLEEYAKHYNKNIFIMPTLVLLDKYKKAIESYQKPKKKPFVIGWIGSKTTSPYIFELLFVLELFMKKYDDIVLHLIGFDDLLLKNKTPKIKIIPWNEDTEIEEILNFDIGIMPLRDDAWARGKCAFKLIQYMSAKKPVIASAVGMNSSLIEEGINGYTVSSNQTWLKALEKLYKDESLRDEMAKNNFAKIEKYYNHATHAKSYSQILKGI
jgi:glycosyltransferase involved in cell wall biosynthesis